MRDIYAACLCGSGKKFKFCCNAIQKSGGAVPVNSEYCKFPVYECKILSDWEEQGISSVFVSREVDKDCYVVIIYLVDFWCLGIKDVIIKFGISGRELAKLYNRNYDFETISYQDARSLILGAKDFANAIDIAPHSSWKGVPFSFIEGQLTYEKKFTFGQQGKPYYVSGPNDYELYNVEEVIKKVIKAKGEYVVHLT
jgi:hypothetical protein